MTRMTKITKITPIPSEPAKCIEVDSPTRLFAAGGETGDAIITHNSVVQRNIIFATIMRPESWRFLGIDLKKVELSAFRAYSNVVLGIATTLEDALQVLQFAQQTMMQRYALLEKMGKNNFLDLPDKGQALMVMVDEAGELLEPNKIKALSGDTPIPYADGSIRLLKDASVGDVILDNYSNPATINDKYEPIEQSKYTMLIRKDTTDEREKIVSGSEHNWTAYFSYPNGEIVGPEIVDTAFLYEFKKKQEKLPQHERVEVKFKKYVHI